MAVCRSAIVGRMEQHAAPAETPDTAVATSELVDDELLVDVDNRHAVVRGETVKFRPTEFKLLECLVRQPGRAFSRQQLMEAAIGDGTMVLERTIDVHVKTLRQKLEKAGAEKELIETVRSVGYRFREEKPEAK